MNKKTLLTLAAFSAPALAIQYGEDVDSSTYEEMNYFVNIINEEDSEKCGGQIIASNWILTARHCTTSWDRDGTGVATDDEAESGTEMTITVYQGVGGYAGYSNETSRIVYEDTAYLYTFGSITETNEKLDELYSDSGLEAALEEAYIGSNIESLFYSADVSATDIAFDTTSGDLALIKLKEPISYRTTLPIGQSHNYDDLAENAPELVVDYDDLNSVSPIYEGLSFTFFGWGNDENGDAPSVMQYGEDEISLASYVQSCTSRMSVSDSFDCSENDLITEEDVTSTSITSVFSTIHYGYFQATGALGNGGDSGTAVIVDGTAYGVTKAISSEYTRFTSFVPYMDWITETIGTLNVPTKVELKEGDETDLISMPVQNLSSESVALSVSALEGNIYVDDSNCSDSLEPLDTCIIDITIYNAEEGEDFSVQWTDSVSTTFIYTEAFSGTYSDGSVYEDGVLVSAAVDSEDDTTDDTTETDTDDSDDATSSSSGSSGGSLGLFGLLGMIGLAFSRRKCKAGK